jgi:hypothetical protein
MAVLAELMAELAVLAVGGFLLVAPVMVVRQELPQQIIPDLVVLMAGQPTRLAIPQYGVAPVLVIMTVDHLYTAAVLVQVQTLALEELLSLAVLAVAQQQGLPPVVVVEPITTKTALLVVMGQLEFGGLRNESACY